MAWQIEFTRNADKAMRKLDKGVAARVFNEYGVNMVTAFTEVGDPRAGGRKKDESALRWRKMRTYYDMMNPAKQRTLLDVARAMAEDF